MPIAEEVFLSDIEAPSSGSAFSPRFPINGVTYRTPEFARGRVLEGNWLNLSIGDSLRIAAQDIPAKVAIIGIDVSLTFAELDMQSESIGAALGAMGLKPGDRALFQVGTCAEFLLAFFGCMKAGVVPVCTLPQYRIAEMQHFAQITLAKAVIVQDDINPRFDQTGLALEIAATTPSVEHVIVARGRREGTHSLQEMANEFSVDEARRALKFTNPGAFDVAVFQLSGGSTNLPKIIPRMHGEYLAAARQLSKRYELTKEDVALWSLPLVHNAGTLFAVLPLSVERRTLVLQPQVDVPLMLRLISAHRVTFTGSIGPVAARILEIPDPKQFDLTSLRQFFALNRAEALEKHLGVTVSQMFGMTEGMVFAASPSSCARLRHSTVGYPVSPGDEVRLIDPIEQTDVPFGHIGELCFRGPNTLTAYFADEAATAASFTADGYFRTGDLMRGHSIEGMTCYSFEGRIKDNVNRGGEKIGAEEIEQLVGQHPAVADVRIVAMPDPTYGEKVCAYIIPHSGETAPSVQNLGSFLLSLGIAKYKLPERIETINAFPLTKVGKVDKAMLRQMIASLIAAEGERR
jgi:non-ribosomal peptide synthetase component E (peptide arylation enzyme)